MEQSWGWEDGNVLGGDERETSWNGGGTHGRVARRDLPQSTGAPGAAREFVRTHLCREHASRALGTVTLAASEFATQAVLGGGGPMLLRLECHQTTVALSVHYLVSEAVAEQRRGLTGLSSQIIAGISRSSGVDAGKRGERRLWCTIPTGCISLATANLGTDFPGPPSAPQAG